MKRRLATGLVALMAAGALFAMQRTSPRYDEMTGPIKVHGCMNETVSTRLFDIDVQQVQFARELEHRYLGQDRVLTTSGLWAIVVARLTARSQSLSVTRSYWDGPQGLRYEQTDRVVNAPSLPPIKLDPGLPIWGRFLFEIRPDQVGDATLVVSQGFAPRLDSEAHIVLNNLPRGADGALVVADRVSIDQPAGLMP